MLQGFYWESYRHGDPKFKDLGYGDTFTWTPPPGATVTSIKTSTGGTCVLATGSIRCSVSGNDLLTPGCKCSLTVDFYADGVTLTPTVTRIWCFGSWDTLKFFSKCAAMASRSLSRPRFDV